MTVSAKTEEPGIAAAIWIDAPLPVVWAEVATIDALAKYSPETTSTEWSDEFDQHRVGGRHER